MAVGWKKRRFGMFLGGRSVFSHQVYFRSVGIRKDAVEGIIIGAVPPWKHRYFARFVPRAGE